MSRSALKVLSVVHGFPPEFRGGTEIYVLKAAQALRELGHDVQIVTGSMVGKDVPEVERLEVEGLKVHRIHRTGLFVDNWDRSFAPEAGVLLRGIIEEQRPDLVHVHHWIRLSRNLVAACAEAGVPAVVTLHDLMSNCPKCFRIRDGSFCTRPVGRESCLDCVPRDPWHGDREIGEEIELYREDFLQELRLARAVLVPSRAQARIVAAHTGMPESRFEVLPHGSIGTSLRLPSGQSASETGTARIRLGHWGHLYPMKGLHLLLAALQRLSAEERARFQVQVWGRAFDEGYRSVLDGLAEGLDVDWRGAYVPEDLQGAALDWAVIPSLAHESYSFVLDEAFLLGLPVIVSDRGALPERAGGAGLAFAAEDAGALAAALRRILDEPELADRCRAAIPGLVPMDRHAAELETVYRRVLGESPGERGRPDPGLAGRHELQRACRQEERLRQLMDARGRMAQEADRADGLARELRLAEESVAGHEAALAALETSVGEYRRRLERRDAEYEELLQARERETADLHASIVGHRAEIDRTVAEFEAGKSYVSDLEGRVRRLHEVIAAGSAELAAARTSTERLNEDLAAAQALIGEKTRALEDWSTVGAGLEARIDAAREGERDARAAMAALGAEVQEAKTALAARTIEIDGLRAGLAAAQDSVRRATGDLDRAALRQRELESEAARDQRARADAERERDALAGRLASLEAVLSRGEELGEHVAARLTALSAELGLPPVPAAGPALWRLPAVVEALSAVVIRARNLLGEMQKSIERLTAEGQTIEEERLRLEARLAAGEAELQARRRHSWFRVAERLAGGRSTPTAGPDGVSAASRPRRGLRVLFVIHDFLPRHAAGSEIYTWRLAKELQKRNDVHLLFTEAHPGVHSYHLREGAYDGLPFTEISHQHTTTNFERTWRDPRMDEIFRGVLDRLRPDVVHFQHLHHLSIDFVTIARGRGIPVVYTLHEYMLLCPRGGQMLRADLERCLRPVPEKCADCIGQYSLEAPVEDDGRARLSARLGRHLPDGLKQTLKALLPKPGAAPGPGAAPAGGREAYVAAAAHRLGAIREVLEGVDLFLAPSRFLKQVFVDAGMIREDRILVSDNGQDPEPFDGLARTPSPRLRVGYIGTIADYKGIHVLVEAMNRLAGEPNLECHVHGSLGTFPDYSRDLQARSRNPHTQFHGRYESAQVGKVLAGLDLLVVPSLWWENSPLTIHEAALASLPVLASDIGGMAEFVVEGRNGMLFTVGDPDALAGRIREVLRDRTILQRLRPETLGVKGIADDARDMEQRYRKLLAAAGRPAPAEAAS